MKLILLGAALVAFTVLVAGLVVLGGILSAAAEMQARHERELHG